MKLGEFKERPILDSPSNVLKRANMDIPKGFIKVWAMFFNNRIIEIVINNEVKMYRIIINAIVTVICGISGWLL